MIDLERLTHSIKAVIACTIGIGLLHLIGIYGDQWIVITIIVVMCAQLYVGSVLQKAYLRFLGTLIGCLFATIAITAFGVTPLSIFGAILISVFIFSYLATGQENLTYAATLGAVTTAIIMLGQAPTLTFAAQRFLEISLGIFIAALVSQFILPVHASTHLRRTQAKTLAMLRDYYKAVIVANHDDTSLDYQELDENIVKTLLKQRQLAKDSISEPLKTPFNPVLFMQSLYCEREMLRSITFMHHALSHFKVHSESIQALPEAQTFNEGIIHSLDTLARACHSTNKIDKIHIPSLQALRDQIQFQATSLPQLNWLYVDGFFFSAEVFINSLTKLAQLFNISVYQEVKMDQKPELPAQPL